MLISGLLPPYQMNVNKRAELVDLIRSSLSKVPKTAEEKNAMHWQVEDGISVTEDSLSTSTPADHWGSGQQTQNRRAELCGVIEKR